MSVPERDGKIPIVVGVTGHRNPKEEDRDILKDAVRGELEALRKRCPHSPLLVMTSLADGADRLCAEVALEIGTELVTVLPMSLDEYANAFDETSLREVNEMCGASSEVFVPDALEPYDIKSGSERDWHYRQAGLYIAKHSHVLLALWDGKEGEDAGCGTASIVNAMLNRTFGESEERQFHPNDRIVIQVTTPRSEGSAKAGLGDDERNTSHQIAGEVRIHGNQKILDKVLRETENFNRDVGIASDRANAAPRAEKGGENASGDRVLRKLQAVYDAADFLSTKNASWHRRYLAVLSIAATALTLAFLLYDEMDLHCLILVCGFMIAGLFIIHSYSRRSRYQEKYLQYRVLAENLRVQMHLRNAGSSCEVSEIMPWNLQLAVPWMRDAISASMIGRAVEHSESILESWIYDQRDYHKGAHGRTAHKQKSNDSIIGAVLILTLVVYAAALIFEIRWGSLFGGAAILSPELCTGIRTGIKIALGTLSAATLFASNYYGKQALPNVMDDHSRMAALYERVVLEVERQGEHEELLIKLAENELNENANWYAYQSKNEPDLGI